MPTVVTLWEKIRENLFDPRYLRLPAGQAGSITRWVRSASAMRTPDSFQPFLSVIKKLKAFVCKGFIIEVR
jgi:hypothetical protein